MKVHSKSFVPAIKFAMALIIVSFIDIILMPVIIFLIDRLGIIHISSFHSDESSSPIGDPVVIPISILIDIVFGVGFLHIAKVFQLGTSSKTLNVALFFFVLILLRYLPLYI